MKHWICALMLAAFAAPGAFAYDYVAAYKDWNVFKAKTGGESICYAVTKAEDKAPKSVDHGDVFMFVSFFPSQSRPQTSLRVSYNLREDLKAKVIIGGSSWSMYSVQNEAFAQNDDEASIERALKKGSELRVEAVSERNTEVAYHFSLSGSSSAIDKAKALCR